MSLGEYLDPVNWSLAFTGPMMNPEFKNFTDGGWVQKQSDRQPSWYEIKAQAKTLPFPISSSCSRSLDR